MFDKLVIAFAALSALIFGFRRGLRYLHILQQDEYAADRFLIWYRAQHGWDTRASVVSLAALVLSWICDLLPASQVLSTFVAAAGACMLWILARREEDPRVFGKLKLVFTNRAKRIGLATLALYGLVLGAAAFVTSAHHFALFWLAVLLAVQSLPFLMLLSVLALRPYETAVQTGYLNQAREKLERLQPFVIGVTGSYGKTSTKHALGEVLQVALGPTFFPRGSINTLMGNTREIRENLQMGHALAVIEMAAYREGSIQKLCDLTHPRAGILTSIGKEHLERFGAIDAIYRAKTELARAIPSDGILVCNGDDPRCRQAAREFQKARTLLYGIESDQHLDCRIAAYTVIAEGMRFSIEWNGKTYQGFTKLLGKASLSNIAAAFTMACALGAQPELALGAIANLEPVANRLSIQRNKKVTRLNDAYNSNPVGFSTALQVLKEFPAQQRLLMTPGMVELGTAQVEENRNIATMAAGICDAVIVVAETNRAAWKEGLLQGGMDMCKIIECRTRDDAFARLLELESDGTVTLIENDLTDWYESTGTF